MENLMSTKKNKIEKIKVKTADIIVTGNEDKQYFEIKYYRIDDEECHIGYSSYDLKTVFNYLNEYFDIVDA